MFYAKSTGGFYVTEIHGSSIPADAVAITKEKHAELLEGQTQGKLIVASDSGIPYLVDAPAPTPAEVIAQYEAALDAHLDSVAKAHRYDNRFTFALRAGFPGPYNTEAVAFATWMDTCNVQAFALLSAVQAGNVTLPTIEEMIAGLPVFSL